MIDEILQKYPALRHIPAEELKALTAYLNTFYERFKQTYTKLKSDFFEKEYLNFLQLLLPSKVVNLDVKDTKIKLSAKIADTLFLTDEEKAYITNETYKDYVYVPNILEELSDSLKGIDITVKEYYTSYPVRTIPVKYIGKSNDEHIFQVIVNNVNDARKYVSYFRENIGPVITILKQNHAYYFSEYTYDYSSAAPTNIVVKVRDYNDIDAFVVDEQYTLELVTNFTLFEILNNNILFSYFVKIYERNVTAYIGDKDELVYLCDIDEFKTLYNFEIVSLTDNVKVVLLPDRDFIAVREYAKLLSQIENKDIVLVGLWAEDNNVFIVVPSKDYHATTQEKVSFQVRASRVTSKSYEAKTALVSFDNILHIYDYTSDNYVAKNVSFAFVLLEDLVFPDTACTNILQKQPELKPHTIISVADFTDTLSKDFEKVYPLESEYVDNFLGFYREPLTFVAFVRDTKNQKLSTDYNVYPYSPGYLNNIQQDYVIALFANVENDELPLVPFTTIRQYSKQYNNFKYYTYLNGFYFYIYEPVFFDPENYAPLYNTYFSEYFGNTSYSVSKYILAPSYTDTKINAFNINEVLIQNNRLILKSNIPIYMPDEVVIRDWDKKFVSKTFYATIKISNDIPFAHLLFDVEFDIIETQYNNNRQRYIQLSFIHTNDNTYFISYLAGVLQATSVKRIVIDNYVSDTYEAQWLAKHRNIILPFTNIQLYRIQPITVQMNYVVRVYPYVSYDIRRKISTELSNITPIEKIDILELIDNCTDLLTTKTLSEKFTNFILDLQLSKIKVFGKTFTANQIYTFNTKIIKPFFVFKPYITVSVVT